MPSPDVVQILQHAEEELRSKAQQALSAGRYAEVAEIVGLADRLAQLTINLESSREPPATGWSDDSGVETIRQSPLEATIRPNSRRRYPRFERQSDRLIKIAWSKRERKEYEHRAPRQVVELLLASIRKRKNPGARFTAPDVFPLKESRTNREVPSYQAYLALSWLVHERVIAKHGREGYSLKGITTSPERVDDLWNALVSRD